MITKTRFVIAAAIVLAGSAAGFTAFRHPSANPAVAPRQAAVAAGSRETQTSAPAEQTPALVAEPVASSSPASRPVSSPVPSPASGAKAKAPVVAKASGQKPPPKPKEPIQDPLARQALSYVGADPLAEQYWVAAINDFSLPADERRELIEDLNEDGFADPKHLTQDDVPLIINRLQLIEDLAPDSLDQVNNAAFQEAYKDLVNMLAKAP